MRFRPAILALLILTPIVPAVRSQDARPAKAPATVYRIARVVDGDTVVFTIDGHATTVRIIGVDTPETVHPSKPVERFGREASAFSEGRVFDGGRMIAL